MTNSIKLTVISGFTLIELAIVLMVVIILLTCAYPTYKTYLMQSHRDDARQSLAQERVFLERCYSSHFSYNAPCDGLSAYPKQSIQGYYRIVLSNLGVLTYTLTAIPIGAQAQDTTCAFMAVNQSNVQTATNSSGASQMVCWHSI